MTAELRDRQEGFAPSAPGRPFGADLAPPYAAFISMRQVTGEMREGDVVQRPKKLDAHTLPWLFMFEAQFFGGFDYLGTLEANILAVFLQETEENHLAEAVAGRPVRHTQKGALASAPVGTYLHRRQWVGTAPARYKTRLCLKLYS